MKVLQINGKTCYIGSLDDFYEIVKEYLGYDAVRWLSYEFQERENQYIEDNTIKDLYVESRVEKYTSTLNDILSLLHSLNKEIYKLRWDKKEIIDLIDAIQKAIEEIH